MLTATLILIATYIGIAFTRLPRINVDRTSASLIGGLLMLLFGVLSYGEAVAAVDFHVIGLLFGMMVISSALQAVGFFNLLVVKTLSVAHTPRRLLVLVIASTAVASAFFVNDVVVLLFTPVIAHACRYRNVSPVPYLIAEAMASNIGSTATIVGNPQNMLIGVSAGIPFARFFFYLFPVALVSTVVLVAVMLLMYRRNFDDGFCEGSAAVPPYDIKTIARLLPALALVLASLFLGPYAGLDLSVVALLGAALVLLAGRAQPSAVIRSIDWTLLVFFAGLFVVIEGAEQAGVLEVFTRNVIITPDLAGIASISVVSTLVSQIVSNVPLTMLVIPIIKDVPGDTLWIALASGSTLGGNLTIIGAVANIIVAEGAAREGIHIGFLEFFKVGLVVTTATVGLSILVLGGEYWLGWLR